MTETIRPGEIHDLRMEASAMVFPPGGSVPEFVWTASDVDSVKADVLVLKEAQTGLSRSLEVQVFTSNVSLTRLGQGKLLKIDFDVTLRARPSTAQGDVDLLVVFRHPKFTYPPVVGGEPRARFRVKLVSTGK